MAAAETAACETPRWLAFRQSARASKPDGHACLLLEVRADRVGWLVCTKLPTK